MPSRVVPRPDGRYGSRITRRGRQVWLGTYDTEQEAALVAARAQSRKVAPSRAGRRRKPKRLRPPTMEVCGQLADAMGSDVLRTFVLVAAWSGLRLSEVAALEARDVAIAPDGATAVLHVRHGKGDKEGWSLLYAPGLLALRPFLDVQLRRSLSAQHPLLVNAIGNRWDRKSVNKVWGKARDRVDGCGELTFHSLRKAHATWLLDQGASDLDVAFQLRHIDYLGRPDPALVRAVYGFPAVDAALERLQGITTPLEQKQGPSTKENRP